MIPTVLFPLVLKFIGVALVVVPILYVVNDYKNLREEKVKNAITIAAQDLEIKDKERRIVEHVQDLKDMKKRAEIAQKGLQQARIDAVKADADIKISKLQSISEKTRFGKTDADGNTLLSRRMEAATVKLFDEIEEITAKHGQ